MYLRVGQEWAEALSKHDVAHKKMGGLCYVAVDEFKRCYDRLSEEPDAGKLVRFDNIVFSADYEKIRQVD